MTVNGCDISHWNEHPPLDMFDFIIHKATQGDYQVDSRYRERAQWAHERGVIFGAYHFYVPNVPNTTQVNYFIDHADIQPGDIVALDFEDDDTWHLHPNRRLADDAAACMRQLIATYPHNRVLLYCNRTCWRNIVSAYGVPLGDGLWIASPANQPAMEWVIWQYGSGSVDYDRANFATINDMRAWVWHHEQQSSLRQQQLLLMG